MQYLKWTAIPLAIIAAPFLFFGLIWQGVVQLGVATVLLAIAASIWRTSTGVWPLNQAEAG